MADDMSIEQQQRPISREDQVAQRWMRIKGIHKPEETRLTGGLGGKENPNQLVGEAYDLFVEKQTLQDDIARKQREVMEPRSVAPVLTLEQKRDLIKQGKIGTILQSVGAAEPFNEVVARSQVRTNEVDARLDEIFSTSGMYEKFHEDLSRQVRVRHQAREVRNLDKFTERADVLAVKLTREAQVQGRTLTSVERQFIDDNQALKLDAIQRRQELLKNPEVFDRVRIMELQEYQRQIQKDRFAETPSRKTYLRKIESYWAEAKKVLLTGETGTGKTEMIKHASNVLFGVNPEPVTGHQDMSIYELLGKTGFRVQEGDVFRPAPLVRAMTGRGGKGQPFLFDEIDRAPNQSVMGIKTVLNARPGEKGIRVQTDSAGSFDVGEDYAVAATANIKSEKYATATELDPAIVRVFDAPMDIDYIPAPEVYDLALASLMDKRGGIPLSESDARTVLKNLCDAASWIQDAYQGRQVVTDPSSGTILEARGQAATGKAASLKKALLDPGRTLDMLNGWSAAQVKGTSFEDYLNQRVAEFINNRAYPDEDRYYLTEIFALKGFLKGRKASELMVSGLTQDTLDRWSGATGRREAKTGVSAYLLADRVAKLDPYRRFKRPVSTEAEELLEDEEQQNKMVQVPEIVTEEMGGEQRAWQELLGSRVEVKPLPASVTLEVRRNLEKFGLELMYLPKLELGTLADLKRLGESRFLDDLQKRYPNWRHYEKMTEREQSDHSVPRNLNEWYWGLVKGENVAFPNLPGQWIAVEKIPKPVYPQNYERTPVGDRLGFSDRFNVSWNDANAAINGIKGKLLTDMGFSGGADVTMLDALPWNLIANRKKWGATDTYEWTNTERRGSGGSRRVIVGRSDYGGAASAGWNHPGLSGDVLGFRVAVVLGS